MDSLMAAKLIQAFEANKHRSPKIPYEVCDHVLLSTLNWRHEYMQKKNGHVEEFMPHFNGPYVIKHAFLETSSHLLDILSTLAKCQTFYATLLKPYNENNDKLASGNNTLCKWTGYGPENDLWCPTREMEDTEALDKWEALKAERDRQRRGDERV
ncbi:hypothetical protein C0995_013661 [Termitomyces sp. Mi166|nr:hypothetical protein C0995_013661 [Termitomyces sp. Mi166\